MDNVAAAIHERKTGAISVTHYGFLKENCIIYGIIENGDTAKDGVVCEARPRDRGNKNVPSVISKPPIQPIGIGVCILEKYAHFLFLIQIIQCNDSV